MDERGSEAPAEKPLSAGARTTLALGVGLVMLSFYFFSLVSVLLLVVLVAGELLVVLALLRFGASRVMVPYMEKHVGLVRLFFRNFQVPKGVEYKISLLQADAPALYEMLDGLCRKLELSFPQEIVLQLADNAFVRLKGLRSGAGKVTLGVGYDLLAGLTVLEIEAVLAHEMAHAKLINRGFKNWLVFGQARVRRVAVALWEETNAERRAKRSSMISGMLFAVVDRMVRLCTRLVAAYSRQDEFEADRGAAQLCGSAVMRSALSKADSLHRMTSQIPWSERVARLQQSSGYSQWLLDELAQGAPASADEPSRNLFNKYSTHPTVRDRLAALPPENNAVAVKSPPALQLLAKPDAIAAKLVNELQRLLAEQEKKDSQALERYSRKAGQNAHLTSWQSFGVFAVLGGIAMALLGLGFSESAIVLEPTALVAIAVGAVAIKLGAYRDGLELPVPGYSVLVRPAAEQQNLQEKEKAIEAELTRRIAAERRSYRAAVLARESYAALNACDYLRAHVAARCCLKQDKRSVEGALALAIACASFRQLPRTIQLLAFVRKRTGCKTFSTAWGSAWAALLAGDWTHAEAMLEKALKLQPAQNTLLSLLAIAQFRRGKLQSAIVNARKACDADPASTAKLKFLIGRLLDGGFTRDAGERLARIKADWGSDPEVMLLLTQFYLLQRNFDEAERWATRLKQVEGSAPRLLRLGSFYEAVRRKEQAAALYQEALGLGHFPEAHLGLSRLEAERNNKVEARRHVLAALDAEKSLGKEAAGPWQIFQPLLAQMLALEEPAANCRAWLAAFPAKAQPAALGGQSFLVYAPDLPQAQAHCQTIVAALQPGKPPVASPIRFGLAPRPMQPDGPVRPGVQCLWR
jgi:Zn-dependent protease with chaperone function